jgi:hypothetical protein
MDRSSHPLISVVSPTVTWANKSPNREETGKTEGLDMRQAIYVGVDVSKKELDLAIRLLGQVFGVSNDCGRLRRRYSYTVPSESRRDHRNHAFALPGSTFAIEKKLIGLVQSLSYN